MLRCKQHIWRVWSSRQELLCQVGAVPLLPFCSSCLCFGIRRSKGKAKPRKDFLSVDCGWSSWLLHAKAGQGRARKLKAPSERKNTLEELNLLQGGCYFFFFHKRRRRGWWWGDVKTNMLFSLCSLDRNLKVFKTAKLCGREFMLLSLFWRGGSASEELGGMVHGCKWVVWAVQCGRPGPSAN